MTKREDIAELARRLDALEKRVFEMSPSVAGISVHEVQQFVQQAWAENNNQGCTEDQRRAPMPLRQLTK